MCCMHVDLYVHTRVYMIWLFRLCVDMCCSVLMCSLRVALFLCWIVVAHVGLSCFVCVCVVLCLHVCIVCSFALY